VTDSTLEPLGRTSNTSGPFLAESLAFLDPPNDDFFRGEASAQARFGNLQANAQVGVTANTAGGGFLQAGAIASWEDEFTVTSDGTTVAGTHVFFRINTGMSGGLSMPGLPEVEVWDPVIGTQYASASTFFTGFGLEGRQLFQEETLQGSFLRSPLNGEYAQGYDSTSTPDISNQLIELVVGETYTASQFLIVHADVQNLVTGAARANYVGTVTFFLDPIITGYGYTTRSGVDYRTPTPTDPPPASVPEPGTLSLMALGGLGIALRRRRAAKSTDASR
jgi:hypothetical protein